MATDSTPLGDHDGALRELLLQQVRTTRDSAMEGRGPQRGPAGRDRWRPLLVTGVVAVAVAAIGFAAINLHLSDRSAPAHATTSSLPVPSGQVVKTLSDTTGGRTQTFALDTAGSAFNILLACTGGSDDSELRVHIPGHSDTAIGCGRGTYSGGDAVDADSGTLPITVTATDGSTRWRVDFVISDPTARGYTDPSERASTVVDPLTTITDPARTGQFLSSSPKVLLHATGSDQTAHSRTLRIPPGITTLRTWLDCTNGAHFAVSLPHHAATGTCAASDAAPFDTPVRAGTTVTLDYAVPEPDGSSYALLVVALPAAAPGAVQLGPTQGRTPLPDTAQH